MTFNNPNSKDPLKAFLDQNELIPPAAPPNEFAMIESRLQPERPSAFWLWISGVAMTTAVVVTIFIQISPHNSQISEEELARFFTESYELDDDGEVVGEHFLSLVER